MEKKIIIGVPAWVDKERLGVGIQYLEYLSQFGNIRLLSPWEEYVEEIDLLVMTGGPDALSAAYGEVPSYYAGNPCTFREFFAQHRLKNYIGKKAILGICLGAQYISNYLGGKLDQHIYHPLDKNDEHEIYYPDGKLITYKENKKDIPLTVNSTHHQAIPKNNIGEGLEIVALSEEGYVEAFKSTHLKIVGLQFHPERGYNPLAHELIKELLNFKK